MAHVPSGPAYPQLQPATQPQLPHIGTGPTWWQVAIYPADSPSDGVTAWMTDTAPQPSGGGGGHEQVVMPMRSPVVVWRGRPDLLTMTLPIMFDGFAQDAGIGEARNRLLSWWRPGTPEAPEEPPVVKVLAQGNAVPYIGLEWVITGLEWGDALADVEMTRTRELHVVTLTEYVPDARIAAQHARGSSAKRHTAKKRKSAGTSTGGARTYRVVSGDTLSGIAARKNVRGGWRALADAQHPPISDPRSLRVGQLLVLP